MPLPSIRVNAYNNDGDVDNFLCDGTNAVNTIEAALDFYFWKYDIITLRRVEFTRRSDAAKLPFHCRNSIVSVKLFAMYVRRTSSMNGRKLHIYVGTSIVRPINNLRVIYLKRFSSCVICQREMMEKLHSFHVVWQTSFVLMPRIETKRTVLNDESFIEETCVRVESNFFSYRLPNDGILNYEMLTSARF